MANRTTAAKVQEILDTALSLEDIDKYITIASSMVDTLATTSLGESTLTEIERWLTAHLIVVTKERRGIKEKLGDAEITYANIFGAALNSTDYGQMVAFLDTSGTLAQQGKKKISIKVVTSFE